MSKEKIVVKTATGNTVKASMVALFAILSLDANADRTATDLLADASFTKLLEAGKGGFSGVSSFIEVDNIKVGRTCAMTGVIFPFNNEEKEASFFYKNGSYVIGGEILKANAMKEFDDAKALELADLEDQMLDGDINPREWKDQVTAIKATGFEFHITDERKAEIVEAYNGYTDKDAFLADVAEGTLPQFVDFAETTEALRAEYVKPDDKEPEDEA